ncbi:PREDICTED: uncharacterized protein LOC107881674 [Prunus mume]|uniref:Uncharacterized protein LOC107881674 n=1 Tax=Prunus mume TaxID=102107 RepID=A0ABM1LVR9_PRUMU|nr:PREDICTED: uncharacterized protein LOC107881674 [Prunus mume]
MSGKIGQVGGNSSTLKKLPSSVGNLTALELLRLDGSAIEELPSSIGNLTVLKKLYLRGCENLANMPQSIYGLQNLGLIDLSRCPKLVTLPNNLISEGLSSAESLPLEVRTNANNPCDGDFMRHGEVYFQECNKDFQHCQRYWKTKTCNMDLSNCHRLCDNLGLDLSKMAKFLLNQMKRSERVIVTLLDSGSEVPEWFTFGDDFDDYDESKFDYVDVDGRSFRNYKLHIEIPWTSVLENTKLVLFAVWEITESFVSPCSLLFKLDDYLDQKYLFGRETREGNVWLECIPISCEQLKTPIFQVTVIGKGLHIKSIGAHLAPISMSKDGDDDGKHIDENELDDDDDVGDEVGPRKRTNI